MSDIAVHPDPIVELNPHMMHLRVLPAGAGLGRGKVGATFRVERMRRVPLPADRQLRRYIAQAAFEIAETTDKAPTPKRPKSPPKTQTGEGS